MMRWVLAIVSLVALTGKLGVTSGMYFFRKRVGVRAFEAQLRRQGLGEVESQLLTDDYRKLFEVRTLLRRIK